MRVPAPRLRRAIPARAFRRIVPARAAKALGRAIAIAGACAFAALATAAGLPLLHRLHAAGWLPAHWYHPAFAATCLLPAAAVHAAAARAGGRGAAWWLAWLPGIAAFAAFPWPEGGTWRPLWILGHARDWARAIFLRWETATPFAFNSFGAFTAMAAASVVAFGRLWLGAAEALGRLGPKAARAGDAEDALPNAAWMPRAEVFRRFGAPGGIVLGEMTDPVTESPGFAPGDRGTWGGQGGGRLITMSPEDGNGHVLVTSQASGYKSTGLVIPNILTYDGPLVVFDPKCELYARTRKAREAMNRTPVVIDADNGFDPARLVAALAARHPAAYFDMAKLMIPKGHGGIENAQYFKAAATNLLAALLAYFGEKGSRNILQGVAALLANSPDDVYGHVHKRIEDSKLPFVQNQLRSLKGMDPKFWYSVKTEITNQLMFCEMPDVARYVTMDADSRLPAQVVDPRCDIYLNVPQHVAENFPAMLRLILGSMLTAAQLVEVNEAPRARRLFLVDEAAKLGNMDILENIRDRGRSLGLHLMMFYQTPGEIERLWGRAGMTSWKDGCSATVMGPVSSRDSAAEISAMVGTKTVKVKTESTSSSSQVMSPTAGSVSTSEQEQLRDVPLISPTAISQLRRHASIITVPGERPILASKAIWFARKDMKGRVRGTEEIRDELAVTSDQEALLERLAEMSRTAEAGEGVEPPATVPDEGAPVPDAGPDGPARPTPRAGESEGTPTSLEGAGDGNGRREAADGDAGGTASAADGPAAAEAPAPDPGADEEDAGPGHEDAGSRSPDEEARAFGMLQVDAPPEEIAAALGWSLRETQAWTAGLVRAGLVPGRVADAKDPAGDEGPERGP